MNEKEIKDITKKSVVKAPHDFTDRLLYRIENEATISKPVQIPVPYIVMGTIVFMGIIALITIYLPESSIAGSSFSSTLFKRGFQVVMALFFLVAIQWMLRIINEIKKI